MFALVRRVSMITNNVKYLGILDDYFVNKLFLAEIGIRGSKKGRKRKKEGERERKREERMEGERWQWPQRERGDRENCYKNKNGERNRNVPEDNH